MKFARPLLITVGVIVVIAVTAMALALNPSIQRWALLRAVAGRPGLKLEVTSVAVGFSTVTLQGVRFEQHGLTVKLDQLTMDYSLWPVLFSHRLSVQRLVASGVMVDASHISRVKAAVAAGSPVAAPGLLAQIKLPYQLLLDDCRVAGRILFPGAAGQPPLEATYEIKGGKFAPGEEGSLRLSATVKNPAADASVGTLNAQISLRATQTALRGFSRVNLTAVVNAEGPNLSEQNQLKITSELAKGSAGENYFLSVDTLIHGAAENLLVLRAGLLTGKNDYAGEWTLNARNTQLEPFFLGLALPNFSTRGEGHLGYSPVSGALDLQGDLAAEASRLEVIDRAWRAVGPVKLNAQFDVTAEAGVARLRQLNVHLANEKEVLELSASQAAEVDFIERRLRVGGVAAGEALMLKLQGVPLAWVAPFVAGVDISGGKITGQFSITGGTDRMLLSAIQPLHIDQLTLAQGGEVLLSKAAVTLALDAEMTEKELKAKVREFTLQTPLGDQFNAQASISIPVAVNPSVSVQASYTADLPALLAPWLPKGYIKAAGDADFSVTGGKVDVRNLSTRLTSERGVYLVNAATLRPFIFDPVTRRVLGEKKAVNLVQISVGRVPLDWLPINGPGAQISGTVEPGEFVLRVDGDKILLQAVTPLKLAGVGLVQDGEPAFTGLAIEALPVFEMSGPAAGLAQTGEVTVKNAAGAIMLTCKGEAVRSLAEGLRASLTFNLDVPTLGTQPLFVETQAVSEGRASGEIRATINAGTQVEARLTVNGLVARESGQLFPVANLSFRGVVQENGKISLQAPLLLDRAGQRSDLNFAIDLTPAGRNFSLDGKVSGEHVELADAIAILSVFSAAGGSRKSAVGPTETVAKVSADPVSAWARFNGQLGLDIKSVSSGKDWVMTGLVGSVLIDPARVSLEKLEASFGEKSQLTAKSELRFTASAQPYQLTGEFSLTEFDVGKLFKAIEPAKPPTIEGLFTVAGHFSGSGETLERTKERTRGQFELTSRQGVFRGLQRATGKVSMTSKAVELGASVLGSLFGSEKATKAAEKVAGQAYFVDQLAQSVGEFNYDQLSLRLVRDDSLNLTLEDISLISPEIRLLGKGAVTYVAGKPLLDQPMTVALSLAARGKTEQLLGKLRLVDGTRDEVGYARTREVVTIGGSLAKPDPTAFFTRIATAKLGDLLESD